MIGSSEAEGRLAFSSGRLVAVLVHLSGTHYEEAEDHWYLEAGFGPCAEKRPVPFKTLDEGSRWIAETLGE